MKIGWPAACTLATLVLAAGCTGDQGDSPRHEATSRSTRPLELHGWSPVTAEAEPHTRAVTCRPSVAPGVTIKLRVPTEYRRLDEASGRAGCSWEAPDAIVAQIRVELSDRSLATEAADERDPAKNGQDAGNSQEGSHDIRLSRGSVFGQPSGELLSFWGDDEGVPLQVREARLAPLTLSMTVSSDGRRLYASAAADFRAVMRSLAVETVRTN